MSRSILGLGYAKCLDCEWRAVGTYESCQRDAERHGKATNHSTVAGSGTMPPEPAVCPSCGQVIRP